MESEASCIVVRSKIYTRAGCVADSIDRDCPVRTTGEIGMGEGKAETETEQINARTSVMAIICLNLFMFFSFLQYLYALLVSRVVVTEP